MSDLTSRVAGMKISRLDQRLGPIVLEAGGSEVPIWTLDVDVIDRLIRTDPFFLEKGADAVERAVGEIQWHSRQWRVSDVNVFCRRYGFRK